VGVAAATVGVADGCDAAARSVLVEGDAVGKDRLKGLPNIPPVSDTLPGFEAFEWNGVFVPTGTSAAIIQKLNAGLNGMLKQPDVTDRLDKLNVEYRPNTPDEFRAFVAAEMERWSRVVKEANIKVG